MKYFALIVLLVILAIFFVPGLVGLTSEYRQGDRVQVVGPGYWNPECHSLIGWLWEFNDPTGHYITCGNEVPQNGLGRITPNNAGTFSGNGCYRVLLDSGQAGWYPASSLRSK